MSHNLFAGGRFKILGELPKCGSETQSKQMLLENGANRLAWSRVATSLQFVKNASTIKRSTIKWGTPVCVCVCVCVFFCTLLFFHLVYLKGNLMVTFFFFFLAAPRGMRNFPNQVSNPRPLQWKRRIFTTGPPGKSLVTFKISLKCPPCPPQVRWWFSMTKEKSQPYSKINL